MSWSRFFRRRYWDDERARELEAYLAQETDDNIARGMTPERAARAARLKLGNPTLIREEIYHMNTLGLVETLWQDFRYGWRLLRRNPTFALVSILTLALGTGANTAIFQLVDVVTLRTLPVSRPDELVDVRIALAPNGRTGRFMSRRPNLTNPLWESIRSEQQAFSTLAAWSTAFFNLAQGGEERPANGLWVSGEFFSMLGVPASVGRVLTDSDDRRGCASPGVVISDAFWKREFGGEPTAVGRTLLLDGHRFEIVGVSRDGFFGIEVGRTFDVAVPICAEPLIAGSRSALDRRDTWFLSAMGRLKPGWSLDQANAHLKTISAGIFSATMPADYSPQEAKDYAAFELAGRYMPTGVSGLRTTYGDPLSILLGVTGLVLLIACANLANLMLARATTREREIAVRLAIGASRRRIVRQLLAESLLVAGLGAAAGALLSQWMSRSLVTFMSTGSDPLFIDLAPDWRVLAFSAALGVAACLVFGLAPALSVTGLVARAAVPTPQAKLRDRATSDRPGFRRALIVVQVALSLVLLVGALLFVRTLRNLTTTDTGFRDEGVLVATMDFRRAGIPPGSRAGLYAQVVDRLRAIPGVDAATQAFTVPLTGAGFWNENIFVDGTTSHAITDINSVGPGFFRVLGTPLRSGRDFDARDTPQSPRVAIVNEAFVRKHFAGKDPLSQGFQIQAPPGQPRRLYRIVGVVGDTKYAELRDPFGPIAYLAAAQETDPGESLRVVLRASTPLAGLNGAVVQALAEVNPAVAVQFQTLSGAIRESLLPERLMATLSGFFGALAVLIATIGLYGVMSYTVSRRRLEIGIRVALGADPRSVVRMVLGEAGRLLAAGVVLGAGLAVVGARSARTLLYGLDPWDPVSLAASAVALGAVALLAVWIPARRASRLAPTVALRES